MKPLNRFLFTLTIISIIVLLTKCKKDNSSSDNSSEIKTQNITGYAQKGPFINGSSVTVYDLQSDLSPTGKSYNSQITDNKGTFEVSNISLSSNYVSLRVDGFYYNEILGQQSAAQITLYALSDIKEKGDINVNILTHLEKSRVEYLMKHGKSFADAKAQAQKEILAIFNIEKSNIKTSENLNISESGDDNAILLAVSSILQSYRTESDLTSLLADISNDIKEDGVLNSSTLGSALIDQAIILDTTFIKNNLAKRYSDIGTTANVPDFGKYIANFILKTGFVATPHLISYPDSGTYGDNILSLSKTTYNGGTDIQHSLAAQLPRGASLKIKITSLGSDYIILGDTITPTPKPVWGAVFGTSTNWSISTFDYSTYSQTFSAQESNKSCDALMLFERGSFLIEYFEMNATLPTWKKTITCN